MMIENNSELLNKPPTLLVTKGSSLVKIRLKSTQIPTQNQTINPAITPSFLVFLNVKRIPGSLPPVFFVVLSDWLLLSPMLVLQCLAAACLPEQAMGTIY